MASTPQPHQDRDTGVIIIRLQNTDPRDVWTLMRCLMSVTRAQDVCSFVSERLETERRRLPGLGEMMDTPVRDGDSREKHYKHYKHYTHAKPQGGVHRP